MLESDLVFSTVHLKGWCEDVQCHPSIPTPQKGMIGHFLDPISTYHPRCEVTIHRSKATDFVANPATSDVKKGVYMYLECVTCHKLGATCKGPNFVAMPAHDLWEWCKKRKAELRLTNQQLAELSGTPKGTIDRVFANDQADFKYETIRPIIRALVGGEFEYAICQDTKDQKADDIAAEQLKRLEEENAKLKDTIAELKEWKAEKKEEIAFLKSDVKEKRGYIRILAVVSAVAILAIITALVVDVMNPEVGFFWREVAEHISGNSTNEADGLLNRIINRRL